MTYCTAVLLMYFWHDTIFAWHYLHLLVLGFKCATFNPIILQRWKRHFLLHFNTTFLSIETFNTFVQLRYSRCVGVLCIVLIKAAVICYISHVTMLQKVVLIILLCNKMQHLQKCLGDFILLPGWIHCL